MEYIYVPSKQVLYMCVTSKYYRLVLGKVYGYVLSAEYEVCTGHERPAVE